MKTDSMRADMERYGEAIMSILLFAASLLGMLFALHSKPHEWTFYLFAILGCLAFCILFNQFSYFYWKCARECKEDQVDDVIKATLLR